MFRISEPTRQQWLAQQRPPATPEQLARIAALVGGSLPAPYAEFVSTFGFVSFGDDPERRDSFSYSLAAPGRQEIREGDIAFLERPDRLVLAYRNLTSAEFEDDEESPKFPPEYLPVGNDAGQGQILLECGPGAVQPGRVWYWPFRETAWGTPHNRTLGFVAEDFHTFINGLRPRSGRS